MGDEIRIVQRAQIGRGLELQRVAWEGRQAVVLVDLRLGQVRGEAPRGGAWVASPIGDEAYRYAGSWTLPRTARARWRQQLDRLMGVADGDR